MCARKKTTFVIAFAVLVIGVTLIVGCSASRPTATTASATTTPVVVVRPTELPLPPTPTLAAVRGSERTAVNVIKATGNLISENQVTLSFQISGRIKEVSIKEGDRVKAGAILSTLDTGTLETQVMQAQALFDAAITTFDKVKAGPTADDIALARSNLDRAKAAVDQAQAAYDRIGGATAPFIAMTPQSLALQQATSAYQGALAQYNLTVKHPTASELAAAAAQVAQAQLALDSAKQTLVNAKLIAPISGTVLSITAKAGESASPGAPMAVVADLSKMQALVNLDETSLASVKVGQPVALTLDVLNGKPLTGKVRKIGLLATSATGVVSVPVTIDIDPTDGLIYPGLSATIEFLTKP